MNLTRRRFLTSTAVAAVAPAVIGRAIEAKPREVIEWRIPPLSEILGPYARQCIYHGVQQAQLRAEGWQINLIDYIETDALPFLRVEHFVVPLRRHVDDCRSISQGKTQCWSTAQRWDDSRGVFVPISDLQIYWLPWQTEARARLPVYLKDAVATAHWYEIPPVERILYS